MKWTNPALAFVLGRLLLGVDFLMHGLVRLPKLAAFRAGLVKNYAATVLPESFVGLFATVLPLAEAALGALLVLGLFTQPALVGGMVLLLVLVFGSGLREQWDAIEAQLVHGLFFGALLLLAQHNRLCLDRRG